MHRVISRMLQVLALGWASATSATLLPPVVIAGSEWLQPVDFVNQGWNDIAAVCDQTTGACNGSLGGNDLSGWAWAGIPDLNALFTASGIPGFTGLDEHTSLEITGASTWAPEFLATFLPTISLEEGSGVFGFLRGPGAPGQNAVGVVATDITGVRGLHFDIAMTDNDYGLLIAPPENYGGWFYRTAVPSPTTLPLLLLGLILLCLSCRKTVLT